MDQIKAFISHSSDDALYVDVLINLIGKNSLVVDRFCFESGERTIDEIIKSIDNSAIFIVLLSLSAFRAQPRQCGGTYSMRTAYHPRSDPDWMDTEPARHTARVQCRHLPEFHIPHPAPCISYRAESGRASWAVPHLLQPIRLSRAFLPPVRNDNR